MTINPTKTEEEEGWSLRVVIRNILKRQRIFVVGGILIGLYIIIELFIEHYYGEVLKRYYEEDLPPFFRRGSLPYRIAFSMFPLSGIALILSVIFGGKFSKSSREFSYICLFMGLLFLIMFITIPYIERTHPPIKKCEKILYPSEFFSEGMGIFDLLPFASCILSGYYTPETHDLSVYSFIIFYFILPFALFYFLLRGLFLGGESGDSGSRKSYTSSSSDDVLIFDLKEMLGDKPAHAIIIIISIYMTRSMVSFVFINLLSYGAAGIGALFVSALITATFKRLIEKTIRFETERERKMELARAVLEEEEDQAEMLKKALWGFFSKLNDFIDQMKNVYEKNRKEYFDNKNKYTSLIQTTLTEYFQEYLNKVEVYLYLTSSQKKTIIEGVKNLSSTIQQLLYPSDPNQPPDFEKAKDTVSTFFFETIAKVGGFVFSVDDIMKMSNQK